MFGDQNTRGAHAGEILIVNANGDKTFDQSFSSEISRSSIRSVVTKAY
jgi:hypothetical protein